MGGVHNKNFNRPNVSAMKSSKIFTVLCVNLFLIAIASPGSAQETLKEILEEKKWEKIIGTWVDEETKGQAFEST